MAGSYKSEDPYPAKCEGCICGIENGRGIWCAVLKKIPSSKEVKQCRRFCPKSILEDGTTVEELP